MPKPHFSTAPEHVQRRMQMVRETDSILRASGGDQTFNVPAAGVFSAMQVAHLAGYAWPIEDVPTPVTNALRELEKSRDGAAVANFRVRNSFALNYEDRCVLKARALEHWAAEPSAAEVAEAERPAREAQQREAAIERRTGELAEVAEAKRLAGMRSKAREQAQKEIEQ
jgi:hypothetical protein